MATGLCQGLRRLPWLLRSATAPGPRLSAPGGRPRREQAKVLAGQEPSNPEGGRSPAIPPFRRVNTHSHGGRASGRGRALRAPEGNRNPEPGTRSRTEGHTSENAMRDVRNRQTECQTEARTGHTRHVPAKSPKRRCARMPPLLAGPAVPGRGVTSMHATRTTDLPQSSLLGICFSLRT